MAIEAAAEMQRETAPVLKDDARTYCSLSCFAMRKEAPWREDQRRISNGE